jgi:protease PrsW
MTVPDCIPVAVPIRRVGSWWRLLAGGLVLFGLGVLLLFGTGNPTLFPTVMLIGNFTVPVAYVSFFYERRHLSRLTMSSTASAFVFGGALGVFAAAALEPLVIRGNGAFEYLLIALIEEFVKVIGVLLIVRRWRHDTELDGLILGAAAGMGFAALESSGYAFGALIQSGGSLSATLVVTLIRGVTASLGHGTWTAILTAVIFRESRAGHLRLTGKVLAGYAVVVALHWLWDLMPSLLSNTVTALPGLLAPELVIGGIGLAILWWRWREGVRLQATESRG